MAQTSSEPDMANILRALAKGIDEGWITHQGGIVGSMARAGEIAFDAELSLQMRINSEALENSYREVSKA